jgi:CMP-N,N'-diacetyllegionaminic acid synthase
MVNIVAIILARGGSKGITKKNLVNFCGKPLLIWSIEQVKKVNEISSIWISSDDKEILDVAKSHYVQTILRPKEISSDTSSTEEGLNHAIKKIELETNNKIDFVICLQATSPIREPSDIKKGIKKIISGNFDSLFSATINKDLLMWEVREKLVPISFDHKKPRRRQELPKQLLENGSFYIFRPKILEDYDYMLSGKVGFIEMEFWKTFEIDEYEDIEFCETLMKHYLLDK